METLAKLVPELYYDLIARVPAGVVLLAMLASDPNFVKPPLTHHDISAILAVAFLFLGYVAGILLSGIGSVIGTLLWELTWWLAKRKDENLRQWLNEFENDLTRMYEFISANERYRAVLIKMNAEVILCANLVVAFLTLEALQIVAIELELSRMLTIRAGLMLSLIAVITRQYFVTRRQRAYLRSMKAINSGGLA